MRAWKILSLPPLLWQSPWPGVALNHLDTTIDEASIDGRARGQSTWVLESDQGLGVLGWEWEQLRRGVVALSDPMCIVSNLRIVDADECPVAESRRALVLNSLVHGAPWQGEVRKRLRERQRSESKPAPIVIPRRGTGRGLALRAA
jgi:hypothetical protein